MPNTAVLTQQRLWKHLVRGLLATLALGAASVGQEVEFLTFTPEAVSADGTTAVGQGNSMGQGRAFRWSPTTGYQDLGDLGGGEAGATAVSADGAVVAGYSTTLTGIRNVFRWTSSGGMEDLGTLGASCSVAAMSQDGSVIVGNSNLGNGNIHAFRWTSSGLEDLTPLLNDSSYAGGVSADGSVVVGIHSAVLHRPFRWTSAGGLQFLTSAFAWSVVVSSDGNVVAGTYEASGGELHAFRWTAAGGMEDLDAPNFAFRLVHAISGDGAVIVGHDYLTGHAFRWTAAGGMEDLGALGALESSASATSEDGSVVTGVWQSSGDTDDGRAFVWSTTSGMQDIGAAIGGALSVPRGISAQGEVVVGRGGGAGFYWRSVEDTTPPQIDCPSVVVAIDSRLGPPGEPVTFVVGATDDTDPAPVVVCVPASGSVFPRGVTMVTCTATDLSGNESTCVFPVVVSLPMRRAP